MHYFVDNASRYLYTVDNKQTNKQMKANKMSKSIKTTIALPTISDNTFLSLSTSKDNNRPSISTMASVHRVENGNITFMIFQDYMKTVASTPCKRASAKALETAHTEAMENIDAITSQAIAHQQAI